MKKLYPLALMVVLFSVGTSASVSIGLQGTYFSPLDSDFKNIYGAGWMYGGEFTFNFNKNLDFWLDGGYFAKTGRLTLTKEETKLTLIPIGAGLRYRIVQRKICPYISVGARYFLFREKNVIGEVNKGGIGFVGKVGLAIFLSNHFGLDINAKYSSCRMKPADFNFDVGGLEAGAGLIISF